MEAVRPATADDAEALAELSRRARTDAREKRGGELLVDHDLPAPGAGDGIDVALDDANRFVLVGTIDDVPVGYAVLRLEAVRTGSPLGVVDEIYVDPDARGVGVGEALMDEVLEICRRNGCRGVDARALPGDRATKNFFETFGLVARAIVVHRRLDP